MLRAIYRSICILLMCGGLGLMALASHQERGSGNRLKPYYTPEEEAEHRADEDWVEPGAPALHIEYLLPAIIAGVIGFLVPGLRSLPRETEDPPVDQ